MTAESHTEPSRGPGSEPRTVGEVLRVRGRLSDAGAVSDVLIRGGRIAAVEPPTGPADLGDERSLLAAPLLDLQHNGYLGWACNDPSVPTSAWLTVRERLLAHGVSRWLPTLITAPLEQLRAALAGLEAARRAEPELTAAWPGYHVEGPFISPEDGFRGAHRADWVRPPSVADYRELQAAAAGRVRMLTLAPELPGAAEVIAAAADDGVVVALGHGNPDEAAVRAAADAGARLVTHFGNGVANLLHRHRNPLWAYLAEPRLTLSLIADGFHLPPTVLRSAFAAKSGQTETGQAVTGQVVLVSDASDLSGRPPGEYRWADRAVVIEPDGRLHLAESEYLAGAWHQLDHGVGHAASVLGLGPLAAWRLGSVAAAALLGEPTGLTTAELTTGLTVGAPADVAVLSWPSVTDGASAKLAPRIDAVLIAGRVRYRAAGFS